MLRHDDYTEPGLYYRFRYTAVLLMLLLCTTAAVLQETDSFTIWSSRALAAIALMAMFVFCYGWTLYALIRENNTLAFRLLWAEAVLLIPLFMTVSNNEEMHYFLAFWVARIPDSYRLRACIYLTAGMVSLATAIALLRGIAWELWALPILVPVYMFVLSICYAAVSERRLRRAALGLNQELQAAQVKLEEASRQSERLRIARDMHDVLGHQLTALILNLEIATHKVGEPALGQVEQALALARMALGDLRNAVSDLRDNAALDFRATLDSMLTQIPGLQISVDCDKDLSINDPVTAEALLRCIQEAVTNTLRHSNANCCNISLRQHGDQLELEVRDDGHCTPHIEPGNGLRGMRERLQQLGGTLHWQSRQGNLLLQASLPLRNKDDQCAFA